MDSKMASLVPVRVEQVPFYDDLIPAALIAVDGEDEPVVYVPVRPICDFIGVSWTGQLRRINRDPVLHTELRSVNVTATDGKQRDMACLPSSMLHGWLFGLNPSRAKPEVRDTLIRYQRECYVVLASAFSPERRDLRRQVTNLRAIVQYLSETSATALEEVGRAHSRIDRAGFVFHDLASEIAQIRARIGMGAKLTAEQAAAIKLRVDEVAGLLGQVPGYSSGGRRKPHAAIWGEVYRTFGVPSYTELQQSQYAAVVAFLDGWFTRLDETLTAALTSGDTVDTPSS